MIDKLEMFLAVAKEQHFGRAAFSLGITQPTLSSGIKQLEEHLGVQLIQRGSRFKGLTPEGQSCLIWARKIVGDVRQLKEEMRYQKYGFTGHIRMAVIPTAVTYAARFATHFAQLHPNVKISILSRTSNHIIEMLENFEIELGLTYIDNEPLGNATAMQLYKEDYAFVCPIDAKLSKYDKLAWSQLKGEKLCLLTPDMQNRRIIDRNLIENNVDAHAMIESSSTVVLVSNITLGAWSTILPLDLAHFLADGKPIKIIPLTGGHDGHNIGLIARDTHTQPPIIKALLREATKIL